MRSVRGRRKSVRLRRKAARRAPRLSSRTQRVAPPRPSSRRRRARRHPTRRPGIRVSGYPGPPGHARIRNGCSRDEIPALRFAAAGMTGKGCGVPRVVVGCDEVPALRFAAAGTTGKGDWPGSRRRCRRTRRRGNAVRGATPLVVPETPRAARGCPGSRRQTSNGLVIGMPQCSKSRVLRVAMRAPWVMQMAAIWPSGAARGRPVDRRRAMTRPYWRADLAE